MTVGERSLLTYQGSAVSMMAQNMALRRDERTTSTEQASHTLQVSHTLQASLTQQASHTLQASHRTFTQASHCVLTAGAMCCTHCRRHAPNPHATGINVLRSHHRRCCVYAQSDSSAFDTNQNFAFNGQNESRSLCLGPTVNRT